MVAWRRGTYTAIVNGSSTISPLLVLRPQPRDLHPNPRHHGSARRVERHPVRIAPGEVRQPLWGQDRAEMLSFWRDDPDAARAAVPDVAFDIDLHPVGQAGPHVGIHVDEDFPIFQR